MQWEHRSARRRSRRTRGVAALVAAGFLAAGSTSAFAGSGDSAPTDAGATVGVTDDTIVLTISGAFSGPYEELSAPTARAAYRTWEHRVNGAGGINGRTVEILEVDNGLTPDGALAACKEAQENGSFMTFQIAGLASEATCLDEAGIPVMMGIPDQVNPDWTHVRYIMEFAAQPRAVAHRIAAENPDATIGVMYNTDLSYGKIGHDAFVATAEEVGLNVVEDIALEANKPTFVPELQTLRDADVDLLVVFLVTDLLGILRDAQSLGWDVPITGAGFGQDQLAMAGQDLMTGVTVLNNWATSETEAFAAYEEQVLDAGLDESDATVLSGGFFSYLLVLEEALTLAGEDLTRENLLAAFDQIQDWDPEGLGPAVTYGPDKFWGTDALFPLECCNPDFTWKTTGPASNFQ